jgi:hypothetical protein
MSGTQMHLERALYIACGLLGFMVAVRRFPSALLLKRAMAGCLLCLAAMILVDAGGAPGRARLREAASLPMAVGLGAAVGCAVILQRLSR